MSRKQPAFGSALWDQVKQVRVTREGGIEAPVKANGKDGIVVGNPPLFVPPQLERKPSLLGRLVARIRGTSRDSGPGNTETVRPHEPVGD